jgi:hypothetical protein
VVQGKITTFIATFLLKALVASLKYRVRVMVFNATFNNNSVISVAVSFIGGGNLSTWRKPLTCRKSLTNFIT